MEYMLSLIKACCNVDKLIVNEFTQEEISFIKKLIPVYSKKKYSFTNPHNLFGQDCQWYDNKLYASFEYSKEMILTKGSTFGSMEGSEMYVKYYEVRYDRTDQLSFLPNQYGIGSITHKFNSLDELKN